MVDKERFIVTGVDRLVDLLEKKKRISTEEAAKLIGVTQPIITEWANFLEEEGFLKIDFGMRDTFLVETELTKAEQKKISKEFWHNKGAFVYPVDQPPRSRKRIVGGLYELRNEVEDLHERLEHFMEKTERKISELNQMRHSDESAEEHLAHKEMGLSKKIASLDKRLFQEQRRFQTVIKDVKTEKIRLEKEKQELLSLRNSEQKLVKQLSDVNSAVESMAGELLNEKKEIKDMKKETSDLKSLEIELLLKEKEDIRRTVQKSNEYRAELLANKSLYDPHSLQKRLAELDAYFMKQKNKFLEINTKLQSINQ